MVGKRSSFTTALQCLALFYAGWALVIFPSLAFPLPLCPEPASRFVVLQEGRGGADQESRTFPQHKILLFCFTMKKEKQNENEKQTNKKLIFFFFFHQTFLKIPSKQNQVSTFHPKKASCNRIVITDDTTGIPRRLHYFYHSQLSVCLMFQTTPPGWEVCSGKPPVASDQMVPDNCKA